jgi:hypothetical protein
MMNRRTRFGLACILAIVLLIPNAIAMAYERDLHYDTVYSLLLLSGVKEEDALWIARASQSLDENAETSPIPEVDAGKSPLWAVRARMWHSLPPFIDNPEANKQYLQRRLNELYKRARYEKDLLTAKIYFGQYLHALADVVSHGEYGAFFGHIRDWKAPDIPGPLKQDKTLMTVNLLVEEIARFQRERFRETPTIVPNKHIQAVVSALKYAAPSDSESIGTREEVARQRMEQELRNAGAPIQIPKWGTGNVKSIPFDGEGKVKVGYIDNNGKVNDGLVIPPQDWEKLITKTVAPKAVEAALAPLGLRQPEVGGIDFTNVRLNYLVDVPASGGGRTFALGLEPDSSGKGADAALAISAFAAAIMLPDHVWWVNLNPAEPYRIIDPLLGQTDAGRVMLEADYLLKVLADEVISPGTTSGDVHWREFFRGPFGSFRGKNIAEWRLWIVPGECRARTAGNEIEITDCRLDVRMNLEAFAAIPLAGDSSESLIRREEVRLRETYVLPALRRIVNDDPRFAELRAVYSSRALAQAYKDRLPGNGALVRLVDSLDLRGFPIATRRHPTQVWQAYAADYGSREQRVMSPFGDGRYVSIKSGGVVFDDVALNAASETEILASSPPGSPRRGLLIASGDAGPARAPSSELIQSAMSAYRASPLADRSLEAAAELLPALAFAKSQEYDVVSREIRGDTDAKIWIALADGLRTGTVVSNPETDAMSFAVWSRREPRAAAKLISTSHPPPLRLFSYALATIASPRAGDLLPGQLLDRLLLPASSLTPDKRVRLLGSLAALSSIITPRATDKFIEELTSGKLADALPSAADVVLIAAETIAVFDVQKAARLHLALRNAIEATGHMHNSELDAADRKLFIFTFRLAGAQQSADPTINAQLARIEWLSDPSKGIQRAVKIVDALADQPPSFNRDNALASALPIYARTDPVRAASVAATIGHPVHRMRAFAVLAVRAIDPIAADLLLAQRILLEAPDWMDKPLR